MTQLRTATPADLQTLLTLDDHCFDDRWAAKTWQQMLSSPKRYRCWLLVNDDGKAIGYVLFSRILDESELLRIGLHSDWRGQGLARQMLSDAQAQLEADGVSSFHLEVRDSNSSAQQLYHRCGWQRSGRRRNYYAGDDGSEDALLFSRILD